jgi:hypothetical protein
MKNKPAGKKKNCGKGINCKGACIERGLQCLTLNNKVKVSQLARNLLGVAKGSAVPLAAERKAAVKAAASNFYKNQTEAGATAFKKELSNLPLRNKSSELKIAIDAKDFFESESTIRGWLKEFISFSGKSNLPVSSITFSDKEGSYYNSYTKKVHIDRYEKDHKAALFHELGHATEATRTSYYSKAKAFLIKESGGKQIDLGPHRP